MTEHVETEVLEEEIVERGPRAAAARKVRALVVEDDPEVTRTCVQALSRLGMRTDVVWTRDDALAALSHRGDPLAFVYADARLLDGTCADAASEIRRLRPAVPFVVASRSIDDVLLADGVAICKTFDAEQFQAAFDAALFDDESRSVLSDAAADLRLADAAALAAPQAEASALAALSLSA